MSLPNTYLLTNGRLIDPAQHLDTMGWLLVEDGLVAGIGRDAPPADIDDVPHIDATGLIVSPGLIDIHVHLREPGGEHKETIASGARAAAAGGFTAVCCMPNTTPAIDNVATIELIHRRAAEAGLCRVYVVAAATLGRQGREPVDYAALAGAGAVAFSDDGDGIEDDAVCRRVFEGVQRVGLPFGQHCEFKAISRRGVMHLGHVSEQLGVVGYDPEGEEAMIARDLALAEETGVHYHVTHISTAKGVDLVRRAKAKGLPITAEVCPHHLLLCDEDVVDVNRTPDPNRKMSPPLRSADDVPVCVAAAREGTIDCVVTDHAPHAAEEKAAGFVQAPMGVVGLETSLGCAAQALLQPGTFDWPELIMRMSTAPARAMHLPGGTLVPGSAADVTLIDPELEWTVDPERFFSKSRNTAFAGWRLKGKAVATILAGKSTHIDDAFASCL